MRVARIWHGTKAEGPGTRTAIWLQGCSIECPGCVNPHLWKSDGGWEASTVELINEVLEANVEGITLLGGEPFDQAEDCAELARHVRLAGKGVVTFTGYQYEELLKSGRQDWASLLAETDLLVDGPYVKELPESDRAWIGSSNQRFLNLTLRYSEVDPALHKNRIEMRVMPSGVVDVCGFATEERLKEIAVSLSMKSRRMNRLG
jgi:anaerobic ribonucleoside-triphosphate reductase activating protein